MNPNELKTRNGVKYPPNAYKADPNAGPAKNPTLLNASLILTFFSTSLGYKIGIYPKNGVKNKDVPLL